MEDERNTQYTQGGESHGDQVEVKDRGLLDTLLGRKKAPEDQEKKQDEVEKEEHHEGGEKKESLLSKLHRTGSSSSSSSSSDEEEEVIDENGEIVKRKKKKGLKEKIKEKLPGHKDKHDVEGEHKPYTPAAPVPTHAHQEPEHKPYVPAPPTPIPTYEAEHKPYVPTPASVETHAYKQDDDHKAYIPATAPPTTTPLTTTHVHHDDNATVVQKVEETPEKGLLDKIKEKLPGGHKKPEDAAGAPAAPHTEEVSSPDGKEKKQGLLGKIMDKIPGYNKTPAEEEHKPASAAAGEHKTDY